MAGEPDVLEGDKTQEQNDAESARDASGGAQEKQRSGGNLNTANKTTAGKSVNNPRLKVMIKACV